MRMQKRNSLYGDFDDPIRQMFAYRGKPDTWECPSCGGEIRVGHSGAFIGSSVDHYTFYRCQGCHANFNWYDIEYKVKPQMEEGERREKRMVYLRAGAWSIFPCCLLGWIIAVLIHWLVPVLPFLVAALIGIGVSVYLVVLLWRWAWK